ncbi:MAG TPA: hypothetical protein VLL52_24510 [Anaerolineae bacterium]|nr:hypothetical protein [Anaerolineae bacterium]
MPNLARYLQQEIPPVALKKGWHSQSEATMLTKEEENLLGYSPRADLLLTHQDTNQRIWLEFEISRADPVANHAKFAMAHLLAPRLKQDIFLSMISPHVTKGRRNLAANMIWVMRSLGIMAYQTLLLPHIHPKEISKLNHLTITDLHQQTVFNVKHELERALAVSHPLGQDETTSIHFIANISEVFHNIHQWNLELQMTTGRQLWGSRATTYFVYNPRTKQFAPSKFCAYIARSLPTTNNLSTFYGATITLAQYIQIPHGLPIFDGQRAHNHLTKTLAMRITTADQSPTVAKIFNHWHSRQPEPINIHPNGPKFIMPPKWYY